MNLRSQAILLALEHVSSIFEAEPLHLLEIGSMFKENEGLSTFIIADFLQKRRSGGRFISIDYDPDHIEACRSLIAVRNPALVSRVELRHGHSLSLLPEILGNFQTVHFALIDGGALPEVCLVEFEQVTAHLAEKGVVLLDDAHALAPSAGYGLPRPFGKATLVLPMLILADYMSNRCEAMRYSNSPGNEGSIPEPRFVRQLLDLNFCDRTSPFALVGGKHKMLVYGNAELVAKAQECLAPIPHVGAAATLLHKVVNKFFKNDSASS